MVHQITITVATGNLPPVSETFLEMDELSNAEIEMVQEMLFRIIEKLHKSRNHGES